MKNSIMLIALAFLAAGTIYSAEESASEAAFKVEKAYLTKCGGTVKIIEKIAAPSADIVAPVNETKYDKHVLGYLEKIDDLRAKILYPLTVVNNTNFDVNLSFEGAAYYYWFVRQDVLYFEDQPNSLTVSPKSRKSLNIKFYDYWKDFYRSSYDVGATWNYYIIFVPNKTVASYTAPANLFCCHWYFLSNDAKIYTYDFKDSFTSGNDTFTTTFKVRDGRYCITFDQSKTSQ